MNKSCIVGQLSNLTNSSLELCMDTTVIGELSHSHLVAIVFICTLGSIVTLIGAPTSFLIVISISTCKEICTYTNAFVASLAARDFIVLGMAVPIFVADYVLGQYPFSSTACKFQLMIIFPLGIGAVLELMNIALSRFVKLCCTPSTYFKIYNRKVTCLLLALSWGISFSVGLPITIRDGFLEEKSQVCSIRGSRFKAITTTTIILLASTLTIVCYSKILRHIWRVKKNLKLCNEGPAAKIQLKKTLAKSCRDFSVFVIYIFLLLPFIIVNAFGMTTPRHLAWDIAKFCSFLNNFTNCIIYGMFNSRFRHCIYRILRLGSVRRKLFQLNTVHPSDPTPRSTLP